MKLCKLSLKPSSSPFFPSARANFFTLGCWSNFWEQGTISSLESTKPCGLGVCGVESPHTTGLLLSYLWDRQDWEGVSARKAKIKSEV